jgi:cytochrome b
MSRAVRHFYLNSMATKQTTYGSHDTWDLPTRWLHWIIALAVVALAFTGFLVYYRQVFYIEGAAPKLALKKLHALVGYVLATCIVLRIVWGFAGNRLARWASVLPGPGSLHDLAVDFRSIVERREDRYLGRSPLSRCSATILYAMLIVMTLTGLVNAAIGLFHPPFGGVVQSYLAAPGIDPATIRPGSPAGIDPAKLPRVVAVKDAFLQVHLWSAYALVLLAILHVAGAVLADVRKGGAIISAMFTGRKLLAGNPIDADDSQR